MPNYCSNKLVVTGEPEKLAEFVKTLDENNKFSFSQVVPIPEELRTIITGGCTIDGEYVRNWRETTDGNGNLKKIALTENEKKRLLSKYGALDWYDWSINNWGAKWDAGAGFGNKGPFMTVGKTEAHVLFDTAWEPPNEWALNASEKFPELTFTLYFSEGGMGFYGMFSVKNGDAVEDTKSGQGVFWKPNAEWDDDTEPEDNLTDECREFLEEHGLHTGG
jgi:hypothetical protein